MLSVVFHLLGGTMSVTGCLKVLLFGSSIFAITATATVGPPEAPKHLEVENVTRDSVTLQWESGYDNGARQHFVLMVLEGGAYVQMTGDIFLNYTDHGINQTCTYTQNGLRSGSNYTMAVTSENDKSPSIDMSNSVEFTTLADTTTQTPVTTTSGSNTFARNALWTTLIICVLQLNIIVESGA